MQMQRSGMSGCCVGTYYYDLGGAHSKYRARNIDEFAIRMLEIGMNQINIAVTNDNQAPERGYLEQLGFKEVFRDGKGKGRMHVHAVDSSVLTAALKPYQEAKQKKYEEEQKKKREAAAKKAEEDRARAEAARKKAEEERQKKIEAGKKELEALKPITSTDPVTIADLRKLYNAYPNLPVNVIMSKAFGFKLDGQYAFPDYERRWDDDGLLRSVNSRLRKRAQVGKVE